MRKRFPDGTMEELCVSKSDIPEDFGLNVEESRNEKRKVWDQCKINGCADCKVDHKDCVLCHQPDSVGQVGRFVYLKVEGDEQGRLKKSCVDRIEEGYGESGFIPSTTQREIKPCSVEGCSDCRESYMGCSKCKEALVKTEEIILDKKVILCMGKKIEGDKSCNIRGCLKCTIGSNGVNECAACDNKKNYYAEAGENNSNRCIQKKEIGSGKGIDLAKDLIRKCLDPLCFNCNDNYQKCSKCIEGSFVKEKTSICSPCSREEGHWIDRSFCRDCHSSCNDI